MREPGSGSREILRILQILVTAPCSTFTHILNPKLRLRNENLVGKERRKITGTQFPIPLPPMGMLSSCLLGVLLMKQKKNREGL